MRTGWSSNACGASRWSASCSRPMRRPACKIAGVTPESAAAKGGLRAAIAWSASMAHRSSARNRASASRTRASCSPIRTSGPRSSSVMRAMAATPSSASCRNSISIVFVWRGDEDGDFNFDFDDEDFARTMPAGVAPQIRSELIRIGPDGKCKGEDCRFRALTEAFRWNGLNLATVDPQLGRYFGTDTGVLVLSAGEDLRAAGGRRDPRSTARPFESRARRWPRCAPGPPTARSSVDISARSQVRHRAGQGAEGDAAFRVPVPPVPPAPPAPPRPPSTACAACAAEARHDSAAAGGATHRAASRRRGDRCARRVAHLDLRRR